MLFSRGIIKVNNLITISAWFPLIQAFFFDVLEAYSNSYSKRRKILYGLRTLSGKYVNRTVIREIYCTIMVFRYW